MISPKHWEVTESMNFKDAMSLVANTVSVLSVRSFNERVHACTISSLVSISVIKDSEMVLFVLKKDSKIGTLIRDVGYFSINVLGKGQASYASEYSSDRKVEFVSQGKWAPHGNELVKLNDCKVFFACTFEKIIEDYPSNIFIARVTTLELENEGSCLVYENRNFGFVNSISKSLKILS